MSRLMRKSTFCICVNKGADQLCSKCKADHAFVFATQIVQFHRVSKSKISSLLAIFCACIAWFVFDLLRNHIVGFLITRLKCLSL